MIHANMISRICLTLLLLGTLSQVVASQPLSNLAQQTDALAKLLGDAFTEEYQRHTIFIDNTPDEKGAIVFLGLSGFDKGNNSRQFMLVFYLSNLHEHPVYPGVDYYSLADYIQVGARHWRYVDTEALIRHSYDQGSGATSVTVPLSIYAPDDAACCPTRKSTTSYQFKVRATGQYGQRITEIKQIAEPPDNKSNTKAGRQNR